LGISIWGGAPPGPGEIFWGTNPRKGFSFPGAIFSPLLRVKGGGGRGIFGGNRGKAGNPGFSFRGGRGQNFSGRQNRQKKKKKKGWGPRVPTGFVFFFFFFVFFPRPGVKIRGKKGGEGLRFFPGGRGPAENFPPQKKGRFQTRAGFSKENFSPFFPRFRFAFLMFLGGEFPPHPKKRFFATSGVLGF